MSNIIRSRYKRSTLIRDRDWSISCGLLLQFIVEFYVESRYLSRQNNFLIIYIYLNASSSLCFVFFVIHILRIPMQFHIFTNIIKRVEFKYRFVSAIKYSRLVGISYIFL